jgi:hypothetical protein
LIAGIAGSAAAPSKGSKKTFRFAPPPGGPRHEGFRGPGGPAVHAEAVVPNKAGNGFVTVTSDAGKVKSVSGSDVTIDESIGTLHYKDVTVSIPSDATVVRNHAKASVADLEEGDFVRVVSSSDGTFVMAEDAAFRKQERRRFGGPGGYWHPGAPAPPPPPGRTY